MELDNKMPLSDYYEYFGPDHTLHITPSNMENQNTKAYIESILNRLLENLSRLQHSPSVAMHARAPDTQLPEEVRRPRLLLLSTRGGPSCPGELLRLASPGCLPPQVLSVHGDSLCVLCRRRPSPMCAARKEVEVGRGSRWAGREGRGRRPRHRRPSTKGLPLRHKKSKTPAPCCLASAGELCTMVASTGAFKPQSEPTSEDQIPDGQCHAVSQNAIDSGCPC